MKDVKDGAGRDAMINDDDGARQAADELVKTFDECEEGFLLCAVRDNDGTYTLRQRGRGRNSLSLIALLVGVIVNTLFMLEDEGIIDDAEARGGCIGGILKGSKDMWQNERERRGKARRTKGGQK